MKNLIFLCLITMIIISIQSCNSDANVTNEKQELPTEIIKQIKALGFNPNDGFVVEGGYIVEGDIFLSDEDLHNHNHADRKNLIVGNEEQYHTTNLVTGLPRTITVSAPTSPAAWSTSVDNAIARYNAENLGLTFSRVGSGANIKISLVNTNQYIASAGFPSGGNPYGSIKYAKKYSTGYSDGFMTTVLAHEMGHCIGFRHTDYMNRAYSCGTGGNEGDGGVGAIHIPGTPTGPDPNSWMLACLGATTNRPFNANDKTALDYLY